MWGDTHRVTLAVSDFGGGLEEETRTFSGGENDIDVAWFCRRFCGGLQTCVDGLKEVGLDEVVSDVSGGAEDGFKGGKRVGLWEMWIYEGGQE
jgi:hypothetical protein